ncbi:MAG: hypothetical protein DHS20C05_16640 [Hyphococcus sp.]|nr:MAG: hypothetical protein DHS20C05_16640 [Marinicaulis sp.]
MTLKTALLAGAPLLFLMACGGNNETASDAKKTASKEAAGETPATETSTVAISNTEKEGDLCLASGPQTPRDISNKAGLNPNMFALAPASTEMNLCNIHTHTNAEHKGPGFSVFVNDSDNGGYACNETTDLTASEMEPMEGAYKSVKPGDTIEVHWVHTSCDITPGEGLGSCLSDTCANPTLRVEAQTFLVVNDRNAGNFLDYRYSGEKSGDFHQAASLPMGTGEPVVFRGSTTGPSYTQSQCSPLEVTWSVRPMCAKVDIASLHKWAEEGNVFNETKSHGVRQLVTAPELLSPIED